MAFLFYSLFFFNLLSKYAAEIMVTSDFNFRVDAGGRTCFFERGKAGQKLEVYYLVVDGQHGDLDISLDVIDPTGNKFVSDYKKPQNAIFKNLILDGIYSICLDNSFSVMNSKLVFCYVSIEDQASESAQESTESQVSVLASDGDEKNQVEALYWTGTDDNGKPYFITVEEIADSMSRTLKHVVKARHMLDLYAASKSRDFYLAEESTFVVDMWSGIQISCMCVVGLVQVYMIKKLFINSKIVRF